MDRRKRSFDRAYRRGVTPWDTGVTPPEVVAFIAACATPGRALDLGCGTGTNALYLARLGWQVVGIDLSELAIEAARAKLAATSLTEVTFLRGDVTDLAALGVEGPFDFVLDIGCYHGIPVGRRKAYVRGVAERTRPEATLLLFAFKRSHRGLIHRPTVEDEVRRRFADSFNVVHVEPGTRPPGAAWFTLRRR